MCIRDRVWSAPGCARVLCPTGLSLGQSATPVAAMDPSDVIENRTFDELTLGASASLRQTPSRDDIALIAVIPGDVNPAHLDEPYAEASMFHRIIGHGM